MKNNELEIYPLSMVWEDLMFINFSMDPQQLQKMLPKGMDLDLFEDKAYITIAPLTMKGFAFKKLSTFFNPSFYECNLRTYVRVNEKVGVYFFSLDAESLLEVLGAKALFHLNYRYRTIYFNLEKGVFRFEMRKAFSRKKTTIIEAKIAKEEQPHDPFTSFISDRSLYFVKNKGHLYQGKVFHPPWKFQKIQEIKLQTDLLKDYKIGRECYAIYAKHTEVQANFIQPNQPPILFYDKNCGLCSSAIRLLMVLDIYKFLRFAPLEGKTYAKFFSTPPIKDRLYLVEDNGKSNGARALLNLLDYLPWFLGFLVILELIPEKTLEKWYDWIALKRKSCPLKPKQLKDDRCLP
ncbi:MAG: DUF393 domain-containing protein [Chlamydiae bacterium]|nr:DUF393 domain-containing protein [Chlamydiota bacterium]